ncbi:DUF3124 domain-containing protein [Psychrobacter phenylpyruvicus]|uniref:Protein of uncharacterized function (DUF3124) n=1 Tax=Psychrobacter phenylpyruvicus TaxID=29432 RepID=A0A379LL05_9GAMM|nr:DUF3124 domain-containing protein [Psychrobacter phenylpyruvicus]SUD91289.1 Protein of uncharacterised function (DUF3124) [Psychrobacter phenylpyruvicus]
MKNSILMATVLVASMGLSGCNPPENDPNILYSDEHKDPIKELEVDAIPSNDMPFQKLYYVPVYSNIYGDEDSPKVMLSATLSIRNTSLDNSLYVTKIDYYNTKGDFVRSYLTKSIELPPMGTLNYIVEKHDDTGGDGANFVVAIESEAKNISPLIESIMIGTFNNKAFSFTSDSLVIEDSKKEAYFSNESR